MATTIQTTFKLRRGKLNEWESKNPVLAEGEPGFALDAKVLKIGDGITAWNDLEFYSDGVDTINDSIYGHVSGKGGRVGGYGFKLLSTETISDTSYSFTVDDASAEVKAINGYAVDDLICFDGVHHIYNRLKIIDMTTNEAGNTVIITERTDDIGKLTVAYDTEGTEIDNWIYVAAKPDIGTGTGFSYAANASGEDTLALGRGAEASGVMSQAIGNYSHAEGRVTIAHYAAHAEGANTQALANSSHAEGKNTITMGDSSHAEGSGSQTFGSNSHAEGGSRTYGANSHAEGNNTEAHGDASHAEGFNTIATGKYAHSSGNGTIAEGTASIAGGYKTKALGGNSITHGTQTKAYGTNSVAFGINNLTGFTYQFDIGFNDTYIEDEKLFFEIPTYIDIEKGEIFYVLTMPDDSYEDRWINYIKIVDVILDDPRMVFKVQYEYLNHWGGGIYEGYFKNESNPQKNTELLFSAENSAVFGAGTNAIYKNQMVIGEYNDISDFNSQNALFVIGNGNGVDRRSNAFVVDKQGNGKFAGTIRDGYGNALNQVAQKIIGKKQNTNGEIFNLYNPTIISTEDGSVSLTVENIAKTYAHAEGYNNTASGTGSHAEGYFTKATGQGAHAEGTGGFNNKTGAVAFVQATGVGSHAEGTNTLASGMYSHAQNTACVASGSHSHAEGYHTDACSESQHVQGKWNIKDTANKYAHIVGNGGSNGVRSNAHTLDWDGNAWYQGTMECSGVILTSPNGTKYKLLVNDDGTLYTSSL